MYDFIKWNSSCHRSVILFRFRFSSVSQSCLTLCNPMDCNTPGLPIHYQLPEFTQTHVDWTSDAMQPSHPLSSPFPLAFNFSQDQGLFKWVSSSHQVAKLLEFQLQHQNIQDLFPLGLTGEISSLSKGLSSTTVWRHQFFSSQPFLLSSSHICTWLVEKPELSLHRPL